ncbi:cysteine--1-D-myo-inosityl 2-amino-2-deoxy-alpha-D-glucopyranoside ligase [Isoptericola aurantiacus]|uniref:cysteine--1-D-myo-inosityl 2-amino-2-deoxy-alpha-D-glucopyranoside ligase n=1 Tax=Isoptericola aurantiacus TaxID=3377839 RepID=UPI00383A671A
MLSWPAPRIPELPAPLDGNRPVVRVHDTTTGGLVDAAPGTTARTYVCGITPYDATHLGHAATYLAFDLLHRAWTDAGKDVTYCSNVTDVDDPLLERATATGQDWRELAASQTALFREDMTALGVVPPQPWTGVVEHVGPIAEAVAQMLADGTAYRVPVEPGAGGADPDLGDVYADLTADPAFGSVSRFDDATMAELFAERGGDPDRDGKKHPLDPLLWRRERPGEPTWEAGVLGTGRPGWHVECAVIARDGIGLPFDVQGGGADLVFPHHEMSVSHGRMLAGPDAAPRAHVHAGLISYAGHKMSKSRGNLVLVSALRQDGVDPMAVRLAVLAHHYRTEWEWTDAVLAAGVARLEHWRAAVSGNGGPAVTALLAELRAALADDLDAPRALTAVDAWADRSLEPGRDTTHDEEGAPGVVARAVDALLGVRL